MDNKSDFQNELLKNLKTPEQVEQERIRAAKDNMKMTISQYCTDIKKMLIDAAKKGEYNNVDGDYIITIEYKTGWELAHNLLEKKQLPGSEKRKVSNRYIAEVVKYEISANQEMLNFFYSEMDALLKSDNITYELYAFDRGIIVEGPMYKKLPYIHIESLNALTWIWPDLYLKCTVKLSK